MADEKKKKKESKEGEQKGYKDKVVVHPDFDEFKNNVRLEGKQAITEVLSRMGRMKLARNMKKLASSGKLKRGRKKMQMRAMTGARASGLGWRGARRQIKQGVAGGKNYSSLSVAQKQRAERIANRKVQKRKTLARVITRARLRGESTVIDNAFNLMLEGKRYHQLLNKNGQVKFDMRFKMYKAKPDVNLSDDGIFDAMKQMQAPAAANDVQEAAIVAFNLIRKYDTSRSVLEHAHAVAKEFGVDIKKLMGE